MLQLSLDYHHLLNVHILRLIMGGMAAASQQHKVDNQL